MESAGDEYRIEWPITDGKIRKWAYDENAILLEQDEDLVLHDWGYGPTLLELAADPHCPKADYILDILDYFSASSIAYQGSEDIDAATRAVAIARVSPVQKIRDWAERQDNRLQLARGAGPVDRDQAVKMGHDVLNSGGRNCPIAIREETADTFLVELSVPGGAHREWLLVDKKTGRFRYSRHWRPGDDQPAWSPAAADG